MPNELDNKKPPRKLPPLPSFLTAATQQAGAKPKLPEFLGRKNPTTTPAPSTLSSQQIVLSSLSNATINRPSTTASSSTQSSKRPLPTPASADHKRQKLQSSNSSKTMANRPYFDTYNPLKIKQNAEKQMYLTLVNLIQRHDYCYHLWLKENGTLDEVNHEYLHNKHKQWPTLKKDFEPKLPNYLNEIFIPREGQYALIQEIIVYFFKSLCASKPTLAQQLVNQLSDSSPLKSLLNFHWLTINKKLETILMGDDENIYSDKLITQSIDESDSDDDYAANDWAIDEYLTDEPEDTVSLITDDNLEPTDTTPLFETLFHELWDESFVEFPEIENIEKQNKPLKQNGAVVAPTGYGKTYCFLFAAVCAINEAKPTAIIVVPNDTLAKQTKTSAIEQFNLPQQKVVVINSKEKKHWNIINNSSLIIITYQSFVKDWFHQKIDKQRIAILIADEIHKGLSELRSQCYFQFPESLQLGFTATPELVSKNVEDVFSIFSVRELPDAIEDGACTPFVHQQVQMELDKLNDDEKNKVGELENHTSNKDNMTAIFRATDIEQVYAIVADLYLNGKNPINDIHNNTQSAMVFCATKKQADKLAQYLNDKLKPYFNSSTDIAASVHSGTSNSDALIDKHKQGEIKILCTVRKLVEGYDNPKVTLCFNLVPCGSKAEYLQRIGRVERIDNDNPNKIALIYDFVWPVVWQKLIINIFPNDGWAMGISNEEKSRVPSTLSSDEMERQHSTKPKLPYHIVANNLAKVTNTKGVTITLKDDEINPYLVEHQKLVKTLADWTKQALEKFKALLRKNELVISSSNNATTRSDSWQSVSQTRLAFQIIHQIEQLSADLTSTAYLRVGDLHQTNNNTKRKIKRKKLGKEATRHALATHLTRVSIMIQQGFDLLSQATARNVPTTFFENFTQKTDAWEKRCKRVNKPETSETKNSKTKLPSRKKLPTQEPRNIEYSSENIRTSDELISDSSSNASLDESSVAASSYLPNQPEIIADTVNDKSVDDFQVPEQSAVVSDGGLKNQIAKIFDRINGTLKEIADKNNLEFDLEIPDDFKPLITAQNEPNNVQITSLKNKSGKVDESSLHVEFNQTLIISFLQKIMHLKRCTKENPNIDNTAAIEALRTKVIIQLNLFCATHNDLPIKDRTEGFGFGHLLYLTGEFSLLKEVHEKVKDNVNAMRYLSSSEFLPLADLVNETKQAEALTEDLFDRIKTVVLIFFEKKYLIRINKSLEDRLVNTVKLVIALRKFIHDKKLITDGNHDSFTHSINDLIQQVLLQFKPIDISDDSTSTSSDSDHIASENELITKQYSYLHDIHWLYSENPELFWQWLDILIDECKLSLSDIYLFGFIEQERYSGFFYTKNYYFLKKIHAVFQSRNPSEQLIFECPRMHEIEPSVTSSEVSKKNYFPKNYTDTNKVQYRWLLSLTELSDVVLSEEDENFAARYQIPSKSRLKNNSTITYTFSYDKTIQKRLLENLNEEQHSSIQNYLTLLNLLKVLFSDTVDDQIKESLKKVAQNMVANFRVDYHATPKITKDDPGIAQLLICNDAIEWLRTIVNNNQNQKAALYNILGHSVQTPFEYLLNECNNETELTTNLFEKIFYTIHIFSGYSIKYINRAINKNRLAEQILGTVKLAEALEKFAGSDRYTILLNAIINLFDPTQKTHPLYLNLHLIYREDESLFWRWAAKLKSKVKLSMNHLQMDKLCGRGCFTSERDSYIKDMELLKKFLEFFPKNDNKPIKVVLESMILPLSIPRCEFLMAICNRNSAELTAFEEEKGKILFENFPGSKRQNEPELTAKERYQVILDLISKTTIHRDELIPAITRLIESPGLEPIFLRNIAIKIENEVSCSSACPDGVSLIKKTYKEKFGHDLTLSEFINPTVNLAASNHRLTSQEVNFANNMSLFFEHQPSEAKASSDGLSEDENLGSDEILEGWRLFLN